MAKQVYMPALGMAQETGTLLRWFKAEGDTVTQGEPLMEVATDKSDVEIEAPASGILRNVAAQEGDEIPVGQVIALIAAEDEDLPAAPSTPAEPAGTEPDSSPSRDVAPTNGSDSNAGASAPPVSPVAARVAAEHGVDIRDVQPQGNRIQKDDVLAYLAGHGEQEAHGAGPRLLPASPKARRLAQEAGLDLAAIAGSGPDGAVLAADVEAARAERAVTAPSTESVASPALAAAASELPMSRMWQVMADRLRESWTTIPHFFLHRDVDVTALVEWRRALQARTETKMTYTDLLVKLAAVTLQRHPRLNAAWHEGRIVLNETVNIGLAVAVEEGLLVPVLHQADQLGVQEIASRRVDLVAQAQAGKLGPDALQGGTFTISNLGMYGVDGFSAIVNPPQAAILAVGRIAERVVAVAGEPAVRPMLTLNLSCDHRVVDGARAAQFLDDLAAALADPLRLLD